MRSYRRSIAGLVLSLALLSPARAMAATEAELDWGMSTMFDVFVLRPLGLVTTVGGAVLMVPAAVLMTVTGHPHEMGKPFHALVVTPARFTFVDPIGAHADAPRDGAPSVAHTPTLARGE